MADKISAASAESLPASSRQDSIISLPDGTRPTSRLSIHKDKNKVLEEIEENEKEEDEHDSKTSKNSSTISEESMHPVVFYIRYQFYKLCYFINWRRYYDKENQILFGRSKWSWLKISTFYSVYYVILYLIFILSIGFATNSINSDSKSIKKIKVKTNSTFSETRNIYSPVYRARIQQPGLAVFPHNNAADFRNPSSSENLIKYNSSNTDDVQALSNILFHRIIRPNLAMCPSEHPVRRYSKRAIETHVYRKSLLRRQYGDQRKAPLIMLRLNKIIDWLPLPITKINKQDSQELRNKIDRFHSGNIYFTCSEKFNKVYDKQSGSYVEDTQSSNLESVKFLNPFAEKYEEDNDNLVNQLLKFNSNGCDEAGEDVGCLPATWFDAYQGNNPFSYQKDKNLRLLEENHDSFSSSNARKVDKIQINTGTHHSGPNSSPSKSESIYNYNEKALSKEAIDKLRESSKRDETVEEFLRKEGLLVDGDVFNGTVPESSNHKHLLNAPLFKKHSHDDDYLSNLDRSKSKNQDAISQEESLREFKKTLEQKEIIRLDKGYKANLINKDINPPIIERHCWPFIMAIIKAADPSKPVKVQCKVWARNIHVEENMSVENSANNMETSFGFLDLSDFAEL